MKRIIITLESLGHRYCQINERNFTKFGIYFFDNRHGHRGVSRTINAIGFDNLRVYLLLRTTNQ